MDPPPPPQDLPPPPPQDDDVLEAALQLHPETRALVYAGLDERHLPQLRALESIGDSAARLRLLEISRDLAQRSARRRARRGLVAAAYDPPGDRSHQNPELWTDGVKSGHQRRLVLGLMAAKLVPAMVAAVRFMSDGSPLHKSVPWRYGHRLRATQEDDIFLFADTYTKATVQVNNRTEGRLVLDCVTLPVAAPGVNNPDRVADVIVLYRNGDGDYLAHTRYGKGDTLDPWEEYSYLHDYLEIAGHLALRRARQIVDTDRLRADHSITAVLGAIELARNVVRAEGAAAIAQSADVATKAAIGALDKYKKYKQQRSAQTAARILGSRRF